MKAVDAYILSTQYTDDEMTACGNITIDETSPADDKVYSSKTLTELAQSGDYPAYAKTEMETVATKIRNYINTLNNPIIIGFNTDQHLPKVPSQGDSSSRDQISYGIHTLRDLTKRFPFNLCVLGGDTHGSSGGAIATMQESALYVANQMDGCACPLAFLVGNHEGGQDNQTITMAQVYKSHVTPSMQNKTIIKVNGASGYYDDDSCNVRFVFLDAFPRLETNYLTANINQILASMLSTIPEGYKTIIFSHHPLDENLPQVSGRKGWNNPTACHATLQTYKDKIIACFCGHVHNNLQVADQDGITFVATTCSGTYELNDGSTRTSGTADYTAYDVFVIDTDNLVIHAIRYGNGDDRDISYAHEEPPAPPRGNILTGVNWTDGKRLNSSATLSDATGYSTTDLIENVNSGDTLYFADGILPMQNVAWTWYNDDGTNNGSQSGIDSTAYGTDWNSGNMYLAGYKSDDSKDFSITYFACNQAKNPEGSGYGNNRFCWGEMDLWQSGYIKSVKIGYDGVHSQNTVKVRFTFPTAKKSVLDIRVNEPFEET